jgi:Rrf2 family protein
MLTQKAKYAVRALAALAEAPRDAPLPIQQIAERARAPHKFLEAILLELRRHGMLASRRGKAGGYVLARAAADIRLGDVIRAIDGPLAPIPCASLGFYRPCTDCEEPETCSIRKVMREVRDATAKVLDHVTIADMATGGSFAPMIA